jgi:hypothetical protein
VLSTELDPDRLPLGAESGRTLARDGLCWNGKRSRQSGWSRVSCRRGVPMRDSLTPLTFRRRLGVEHLGKSLREMEPTLHRLVRLYPHAVQAATLTPSSQNTKYQLHVCGEGGEYETFTVDCPIFRQRIILYASFNAPVARKNSLLRLQRQNHNHHLQFGPLLDGRPSPPRFVLSRSQARLPSLGNI